MQHSESMTKKRINLPVMSSAKVVTTINTSQRVMNRLLATCLSHHDLNIAQWSLIGALESGPQTPSSIARYLHIESAYVALILRQLRERGDILYETSIQDDTRSKTISLSENGSKFVAEVEAMLQVCLKRELSQKIAASDLQTFFKVSEFIAENVKHLEV